MTTPTPLFRFFTTALAVALLAALGAAPAAQAQDNIRVFEAFEDGTVGQDDEDWFEYGGGDNSALVSGDAPSSTNGGDQSLAVTDSGDVQFTGTSTPNSTVNVDGRDGNFFNFYIKPDDNVQFDLQIEIEDRKNGEFSKSAREVFQYRVYSTDPGTGWKLVSIPMNEFQYLSGRSADTSDGRISKINKVALQTENHQGQQVTYNMDYIAVSENEPIPVELTTFEALADEDDAAAVLRWKTASETGNDGFRVMHAAPGASSFQQVDFVDGHGTTTSPQDYRFRIGDLASGTHRFRLQQVDRDGSVTPSPVVEATIRADQRALLTPTGANPFQSQTTLRYSSSRGGAASVSLYDVRGRKVRTLHEGTLSAGSSREVTVAADGLSSGTYFVRFRAPGGATATQSITLVK